MKAVRKAVNGVKQLFAPKAKKLNAERWVFTQKEADNISKLVGVASNQEEFICDVPDSRRGDGHLVASVTALRNGEITNRYSDGTVGVPPKVQEMADSVESYTHPELGVVADVWKDVMVNAETGILVSFAQRNHKKKR